MSSDFLASTFFFFLLFRCGIGNDVRIDSFNGLAALFSSFELHSRPALLLSPPVALQDD